MKLYVYQIYPIDFNWEFLQEAETVAERMYQEIKGKLSHPSPNEYRRNVTRELDEFVSAWGKAAREAVASGYGDSCHCMGGTVFWVPSDTDFRYGFVFKESNNGTTYVVSPHELPHLNEVSASPYRVVEY